MKQKLVKYGVTEQISVKFGEIVNECVECCGVCNIKFPNNHVYVLYASTLSLRFTPIHRVVDSNPKYITTVEKLLKKYGADTIVIAYDFENWSE